MSRIIFVFLILSFALDARSELPSTLQALRAKHESVSSLRFIYRERFDFNGLSKNSSDQEIFEAEVQAVKGKIRAEYQFRTSKSSFPRTGTFLVDGVNEWHHVSMVNASGPSALEKRPLQFLKKVQEKLQDLTERGGEVNCPAFERLFHPQFRGSTWSPFTFYKDLEKRKLVPLVSGEERAWKIPGDGPCGEVHLWFDSHGMLKKFEVVKNGSQEDKPVVFLGEFLSVQRNERVPDETFEVTIDDYPGAQLIELSPDRIADGLRRNLALSAEGGAKEIVPSQ